ncbi:PaaI family thioesterase [Acidovorax lacteus]|uniref:PaaI family thioesterase n=1 Tax=Acidovorax lacteus TaxID=1924988 RepID=A0ABP8L917_9BURK
MSTPPTANATPQIPPGFRPIAAGGPYMQHNGPLYLRHEAGLVRFGFRVEARHCNPMGNLHGGMMASFCDMLLPLSAHRTVAEVAHRFLPTVSLQLDYLAPAPEGCWVEGEATVLRTTRSLVFIQGLVTADGTPCVRASGVFKIGPEMPQGARP